MSGPAEPVGLTEQEVERTFSAHLPETTIVFPPHDQFIALAMITPIITDQIHQGIYTRDTIWWELISPAISLPAANLVSVDVALIRYHMGTVPTLFGLGYAAYVALHEGHHLTHHHTHCSLGEQLRREVECAEALAAHHPLITTHAQLAMQVSPSIQHIERRITNRRRTHG